MKKIICKASGKKALSLILTATLLSQTLIINGFAVGATSENDEDNYLIYSLSEEKPVVINYETAFINGSVHTGNQVEFTGNGSCVVDDTINTELPVSENIIFGNISDEKLTIPDYTDMLVDDLLYDDCYAENVAFDNIEYDISKGLSTEGSLILDQTTLKNNGYIKAANNIKYNALSNNTSGYNVFMYSENGDIYIQGANITLNGIFYAPKGKIEINAKKLTVNGMIIADSVELNGTEVVVNKLTDEEILDYEPAFDINVTGELKENRTVTLDISHNEDIDKLIENETTWRVSSVNGLNNDAVCIADSDNYFKKDIIIKEQGEYLVEVDVATKYKKYKIQKTISITDDLTPVADFIVDKEFFRTEADGTANIVATDISYSPDADVIQNRKWEIFYDSDNDGDFLDEVSEVISDANECSLSYKTSKVGKYKIELTVTESFENTLVQFITENDYLKADTSAKLLDSKVVIVDNKAPETALEIEKSKDIDIVFTVGTADVDKIGQYSARIEDIKTSLEERGFNVSISTVETSTLTAQDTFAWTEYDHINYIDRYVPSIEKHILYEENNIKMMGYGYAPLTDFLFVDDNDESQKILSFDMRRDQNNWHTMEGGGFLVNTAINEGYLTGYSVLLTAQGLKLIYLENINVENLRNGTPNLLQRAGKVLSNVNVGNVLDNHSIKIVADSKNISVWDNGSLVIDNYLLPNEPIGYGYGPITSHTSHSCSQQSYFTFANIKMETVKGETLSGVLENYEWTSNDNRFVINLSDNTVQDLRTEQLIANTTKSILEKNIKFIGLGAEESAEQYKELFKNINGIYCDSEDVDISIENIKNYVVNNVENNSYDISEYITTQDKVKYIDNYSDAENDPIYTTLYSYNYDSTLYESGLANESGEFTSELPVTQFANTGAYKISIKVKDNPVGGSDEFESYRKWSNGSEYKQITVHSAPIANFKADVYLNKTDITKSIVKISESSYDLDHMSDTNKGIIEKKYQWKKLGDEAWTDGTIPETILNDEIYLLKLAVCDIEGKWSAPCVAVISSESINNDFIDEEKPVVGLSLSSEEVEYGNEIIIAVSATDNICVGELKTYLDGNLLLEKAGTIKVVCTDEGEHTVKVVATDVFGNQTVAEKKYYVVDNRDKKQPTIEITSPNGTTIATEKLQVMGSVYDDVKLSYFKVEYRLKGEEYTIATYKTEPVINGMLAELDIEVKNNNIYEIRITAEDSSGNTAYVNMEYKITVEEPTEPPTKPTEAPTKPTEAPTKPTEPNIDVQKPEITLTSDKETVKVGETFNITAYAVDNVELKSIQIYLNGDLFYDKGCTIEIVEDSAGIVTVKVVAIDTSGNISEKQISVTVIDDTIIVPKPTVELNEINTDSAVSGIVEFKGTANDLSYYRLMYRLQGKNEFVVFYEGKTPVSNDKLGELNTTFLENGIYTIRLLAANSNGEESYKDITITVYNDQEIDKLDFERPFVELSGNVRNGAVVAVGSEIEISVMAADNKNVKSVTAYLNGEIIEPESSNSSRNSTQTKIYSFVTDEAGFYKFEVITLDANENEGYSEFSIRAVDTRVSNTATCNITSPQSGTLDIDEYNNITDNRTVLTEATEIKGTASAEDFVKYELAYARANSDDYIIFAEGTESVVDGVLGVFDPTTLENGLYNIRLTAYTVSNRYTEATISVQVKSNNKIGNYSVSYNDVSIPLYTLPFTVTRAYSSMARSESGDFGYGWNMEIADIKVDVSNSFSNGWKEVVSSGSFGLAVYTITEIKPHIVTITYTNGDTETFYLTISPKASGLYPIEYINSYQMVGDIETTSKLEILDEYSQLYFHRSSGTIYELDTMTPFDPQNFKLTTKNGIEYILNVSEGVKSITDKKGNVVTFSDDGITHSDGKNVVFERDSENRITKVTDPTGKSVKYTYDRYGDLTAVTDRQGNTVHYIYGRNHELLDIIDPTGTGVVLNEYDDNGRLIATADANGNRIEYAFNTDERQEIVTDLLGNQTVYSYDAQGNVLSITDSDGNVIKYEYDENNNKIKETDKMGNSVSYTYDKDNNLTTVTDAQGNVRKMSYNEKGELSTLTSGTDTLLLYTYDKYNYIDTVTDELGNKQDYEYDTRGALTSLSDSIGTLQTLVYDDTGNIKSSTNASGLVENCTYDENGLCISKTITSKDGTNRTEFYTYDNNGNLTGVTDTLGNYSYGTYDEVGQLISSTDRLGNTIKYEYDLLGNLTTIKYPDNSTECFTYDKAGRKTSSTDRNGNTTTHKYDKFGDVIEEVYADGSSSKFKYDLLGNVIEAVDSKGNTTKFEYDSLYRNTTVVDALGNRTEYTYDKYSNVISMKDPNGNTYKFEYDLAGNCTKTICPDETSISSEYDVRGRLVSETDPSGSKTTYTYDNANQLTSVTDALNNTTLYTYSSTGNLLSVTDANGNVTSYKYDALDRLVSTTLPTGGEIALAYDKEGNVTSSTNLNGVTTTYEYDCNGNLVKEKADTDTTFYTYTNGLLTEVKKNDESIKYIYNALNQISEKILSDGTSIKYNYDTNGNLIKVSTPYTSTSYEYDKLNRIVKVLDRNGNATLYEYDANGNRTAVKYANGITATYTYDSLNRLTKEKLVNANGDNVATYTYTLDQKGNRIKAVDDNTTTQYEYDKVNRLTKETVTQAGTSTVTTYTYDKVGNRLTKTTDGVKTDYTYNKYNQLLSEKTNGLTTSYTYDANGNLLKQSDGTSTSVYTYDVYNRMITATVTKNGSTTKDVYTYDAEGNRLTKTTNGVLTRYIVDSIGLAQVIAELNADGNVTAEYTHGTEVISQNRSGIVHYYLFDGNGNIRKLTDSTGVVTDTYTYDAFGVTTASTGVTANPYRYCGEYQDETTGLYYLRARYYDTATGRFTSADSYSGTTSDPISLHKYLYAHANPVMNSDPTGYFTLFEMSIAMNVQNTLRDTYNSAIIDGFL
ncbi:MAG: RHS repeat-associated core domain-containing protein, partial [Acutalibacteraceae bacterium]|nr:RHS repeat-associated core domain-containing protein [Acutalibacteraceae bacterium]